MALHFSTSITHLINLVHTVTVEEVFIVTDNHCRNHCVSKLIEKDLVPAANVFIFPQGEESKSNETYIEGINFLANHNASRNAMILNIGGGVTTDLGGFIATTYKRGIPFINIPTSLLGMVDAAHGGKVGINHGSLKNYIGAFSDPTHTIICPSFLQTLPNEHLISGYAEMLKHGIIADVTYWNALKKQSPLSVDAPFWLAHIKKSIDIKSEIVKSDPSEKGLRKILNFGHTVGHAIESHMLHTGTPILHGYAVAMGMIIESQVACQINGLDSAASQDITSHLIDLYGSLNVKRTDVDAIIKLMSFDKKNDNRSIMMALPNKIGTCTYNIPVEGDIIKSCLIHTLKE
ncbi:MAG: 3-dehydroquinate synthase [bacterium]|jgi:3-dehydroquinate synthase